ncbi:hypothetical protein GCM10010266_69800 [Streptomyces griseomycini]|nr:hypothetical protein GCM10010266_69800 [Streptomyces griseomycini]
MKCGLEGDREFVGPCGRAAPPLQPAEAPFGDVPALAGLLVGRRRAACGTAAPEPVGDPVRALRNGAGGTALP